MRNARQASEIERLQQCLKRLDEQARTLLLLRYYEDLAYRAIAKQLWMTESTVRRRIQAAQNQLKHLLNRRDTEEYDT